MPNAIDAFLDVIDDEFLGDSWNAPPLMKTLDGLSAAEAASEETWEGYSAWAIALHCAKCKHIVARDLGTELPTWPYDESLWFPLPAVRDEAAWARDRALLRSCHEAAAKALRAMPESLLEAEMPSWKKPWKRVVAWYVTHDAFHGAQLRSMGLPSLKEKRHD